MAESPLAGLRIGAVSYLNTKPLIWTITEPLTLNVPSQLAESFYAGQLDVALLPIFEVLKHGGGAVVDDTAIGCLGEVFSVIVASRGPFADCGTISLDPASRSSAALLRVLAAEFYPHLDIREGSPPGDAARLMIGDPAIAFHRNLPKEWQSQDLGELWLQHTGLPFVFAVWALQSGLANSSLVAAELRACKDSGLAARSQIAKQSEDPAFARDYLTRLIRYDIGPAEKEAIALFATLAEKHGLVQTRPQLTFI